MNTFQKQTMQSTQQAVPLSKNPSSVSNPVNETEQAEKFRKWIEVEVLKIIKEQMKKSDSSQDRLKNIAARTLDLIKPGMTTEELFQQALLLNDDGFQELDPVVIKLMKEYEEKYNRQAIEQVTKFVKSGNFDKAEDIVKKVLEFKMLDK